MATLKDIAALLDLSVTQVSRALNDHSDVNETTRQRVKKAAKSLHYQPNISARKLVSGRSGMVGLVVPRSVQLDHDGLFLEVVSGLSSQFSGRGMQFVLHIAQEDEPVLSVYQRLIGSGALDGFVLTEPLDDDPRISFLAAQGVPFVVHGRTAQQVDYPYFDIDNHRLSQDATIHLTARGHRQIALINGAAGRSYATARIAGYHQGLRAAGVQPDPALLCQGRMDESLGLISTVRLFSGAGPFPTAILCGNILIAKGVYRALDALGLSIPQDVSVIAHDDHLPNLRGSAFFPALTVTKSPIRDSWLPMADFLAGAIAGLPVAQLQRVADYEFIARNSVAEVPARQRAPRG